MAVSFGTAHSANSRYRWPWLADAGGYAYSHAVGTHVISSNVVIDTKTMAGLYNTGVTNDSYDFIATIYLHEVMHALGMAHVSDPKAIMNPGPFTSRLSRGDIAGLTRIKAQACF